MGSVDPTPLIASPVVHAPDSLGPFQLPTDYRFEEELQCDPPRPIPPEARQGRLARKQRTAFWVFLFIGVIGLLCSPLPIVHTWGLYFLPLEYLRWISVVSLSLAFLGPIVRLLVRGPYRYIEEGIPLVARIRELILQPAAIHNGQPVSYRFVALIDYCDSRTGQIVATSTNSNDFSAASRNSLTTSFNVGDYVTAVYLPKNLTKSLRLYGFLDLRPDIGLIATEHREETGLVKLLLTVILGFGFFGALFWNVYAFGRYAPLEWNFAQLAIPFTAGAILLGGGLLTFLAVSQARNRRRVAERNEIALAAGKPVEMEPAKPGWFGFHGRFLSLVLIAGAMLLGGGTAMCWAFSLNALLDNSPPRHEPAVITEMVMITHSFIIREYQIKYQLLKGDQKHQSLLSTPEHMHQFQGPLALAEIRSGWLGWPWVKDLAPLQAPAGLKEAADKDRQD